MCEDRAGNAAEVSNQYKSQVGRLADPLTERLYHREPLKAKLEERRRKLHIELDALTRAIELCTEERMQDLEFLELTAMLKLR